VTRGTRMRHSRERNHRSPRFLVGLPLVPDLGGLGGGNLGLLSHSGSGSQGGRGGDVFSGHDVMWGVERGWLRVIARLTRLMYSSWYRIPGTRRA
jgi:hypothetical protein